MTEDKFYKKGIYFYNKKKYRTASRNFEKAIQSKPEFEKAWLYKGKSLYALENYGEAKVCIDRAIELNPTSVDSLLFKVELSLKIGTYEEALKYCNEALKIHPNKYWLQMAYIHERFKNFKEALECIEKALTYNPNSKKLLRLKLVMLNGLEYGDNYYIPVARSSLLKIIPPEDEIIYSTNLCITWKIRPEDQERASALTVLSALIHPLLASMEMIIHIEQDKGTFFTDALITYEGLALLMPSIFTNEPDWKPKPPSFKYLHWNKVSLSSGGEMTLGSVLRCNLNPIWYYEPREIFERRKKFFYSYITKRRYYYTKNCLENAKSCTQREENEKAMQWIKKGYRSNVYHHKLDLNDELIAIEGSIHRKKRFDKKKMVEEIDVILTNYLKKNEGKAFTSHSLLEKLDNVIENSEILEHLQDNIEGILNRLLFNGKIHSNRHEGKVYYFL
ncbi:MAG: tetratricopeptide repeat protein [Promethearchaeota archaeon]